MSVQLAANRVTLDPYRELNKDGLDLLCAPSSVPFKDIASRVKSLPGCVCVGCPLLRGGRPDCFCFQYINIQSKAIWEARPTSARTRFMTFVVSFRRRLVDEGRCFVAKRGTQDDGR